MSERTELGDALLRLARNAIARQLGLPTLPDVDHAALERPGATFVTLKKHGTLRGCIGSLQAHRPLRQDVRENACAAAFRDPRFAPLAAAEFPDTRVEVSLLSEPEFMDFTGEEDALAQLCPGVDGVIFFHGCLRSTFLPQVWQDLPDPRQFMAQLKRKAGLEPDFWDANVMLARYRVEKWKEPEPRPAVAASGGQRG